MNSFCLSEYPSQGDELVDIASTEPFIGHPKLRVHTEVSKVVKLMDMAS